MYEREEGYSLSMLVLSALGAVLAVVCLAGVGAVSGWIMLALDHKPAPAAQIAQVAQQRCNICGVVERVREIELREPAAAGLSGGMSGHSSRPAGIEGIVTLLAAISGSQARTPAVPLRAYEVSVRLRDGSVRVLRDTVAPRWKEGDQVRVIRGRIEAMTS